jgi:hypothetical protein
MVAQGFSSALVQTAANGGQAGVEAFLNDLISGQIGAVGDAERAEINQLTTQYTAAVATNDYTTQATILNALTERWMNNHPGDTRAQALAQVTAGLGWTVDAIHLTQEANGRVTAGNTITPAYDDDDNLMPGVVNPNDTPAQQREQLLAALARQGITGSAATDIADDTFTFINGQQIPGLPAFATGAEAAQYVADVNEGEAVKELIAEADDFEPGDSRELVAANGNTNPDETRLGRLRTTLNRFLLVDDPSHIASIRAVLDTHIERYERLEADALAAGNTSLARDYAFERQMYSDTAAQLGYGSERWRTDQVSNYALQLGARPDSSYSQADIQSAAGRFLRGESIAGNPVDEYVRTSLLTDNKLLWSAVMSRGNIGLLFGQDGVGTNSGVRLPDQGARELGRLGFGTAATTGLQALGNVGVNPALKPGTTLFGDDMHDRIGRLIADKYPGLEFDIRTRPGQTGVDITLLSNKPEDIARVGFQRAEIKPLSESGYRTYQRQVENWGYTPDQVKPITYDARGNVYFGFGSIGRKK